jgi:DNA-binding FadR family transcriptional regulator
MVLKLGKVWRGPHLSTLVSSSIAREIAQGRLSPGDQLPTEQALASTFGVSRSVVREAIARLRSEGRVWSRQGRGAFVSEAPPSTVLTIDPDELQHRSSFGNLFEVRSILEGAAAALAAQRRTDSDIDVMQEILASMADAPYGSVVWLRRDLDFHRSIASATRNLYMAQFLVFVAERIRESILASGHQQGSHGMAQMTLTEHQRILDSIVSRDAVAACDAMRTHLTAAAQRVGLLAELNGAVEMGLRGYEPHQPSPHQTSSDAPGGPSDATARRP